MKLTSPSKAGFGLDTYQQANAAAHSLLAQFEFLCAKYNSKSLKNVGVSYTKLLVVPAAILKFGWTDELSIDCCMKGIWGKVGALGGAGCEPGDRCGHHAHEHQRTGRRHDPKRRAGDSVDESGEALAECCIPPRKPRDIS